MQNIHTKGLLALLVSVINASPKFASLDLGCHILKLTKNLLVPIRSSPITLRSVPNFLFSGCTNNIVQAGSESPSNKELYVW